MRNIVKKGISRTVIALALVIIVIVAGVAIYLLYYQQPAGPEVPSEIKIGFTISETGPFSLGAANHLRGFRIWEEEVEKQGGIYVKAYDQRIPVKLIYYNDESDPTKAYTLYEHLATVDEVHGLMAPFGSTLTSTVAPISDKYKVMMMTISASAPPLYARGYRYFVSGANPYAYDWPVGMFELFVELGVETCAIINTKEPFPDTLAIGHQLQISAQGLELVYFESFPSATTNFIPILTAVKALDPDVLLAETAAEPQGLMIIQQLREIEWLPKLFVNSLVGINPAAMIETIGKDSYGLIGPAEWIETVEYEVNLGLDNSEFLVEYERLFQNDPPCTTNVPNAYVNCLLLEHAMGIADSLDAADLKKALVDMNDENIVNIMGYYRILETGRQIGGKMLPLQAQWDAEAGEIVMEVLYPPEVATADPIYPIPAWDDPSRP